MIEPNDNDSVVLGHLAHAPCARLSLYNCGVLTTALPPPAAYPNT